MKHQKSEKNHNRPDVDHRRRRTLKGMASFGASGLVSGWSGVALANSALAAPDANGRATTNARQLDLDATLISGRDVAEDTLLLRNLTDSDISISRFHANRVVFDGDMIDCNDACTEGSIKVPAGREVSVQIKPILANAVNAIESPAGDFIAVDTVERLPHGTRIVHLSAYMAGSAAVLVQSPLHVAA